MNNNKNQFYKVSFLQFKSDIEEISIKNIWTEKDILTIYNNIKLPRQATTGSAGHDFFSPFSFNLKPLESIKIPTGIRCQLVQGRFLAIFPRSGLGFKYRLQLDNTVGIIDMDYFNADNEGHILIKITNDTHENKFIDINSGDAIAQGIIMKYEIAENAEADTSDVRVGGFGSTDK